MQCYNLWTINILNIIILFIIPITYKSKLCVILRISYVPLYRNYWNNICLSNRTFIVLKHYPLLFTSCLAIGRITFAIHNTLAITIRKLFRISMCSNQLFEVLQDIELTLFWVRIPVIIWNERNPLSYSILKPATTNNIKMVIMTRYKAVVYLFRTRISETVKSIFEYKRILSSLEIQIARFNWR